MRKGGQRWIICHGVGLGTESVFALNNRMVPDQMGLCRPRRLGPWRKIGHHHHHSIWPYRAGYARTVINVSYPRAVMESGELVSDPHKAKADNEGWVPRKDPLTLTKKGSSDWICSVFSRIRQMP